MPTTTKKPSWKDKISAFGRKLRDRAWPKVKALYLKWYDVIFLLPAALILFIFNERWLRLIDQTAASMSLEFLGILNFNILKFVLVNVAGYVIYNLYIGDYFEKDWVAKKLPNNPVAGAVLNVVLWLASLATAAYIILQGV